MAAATLPLEEAETFLLPQGRVYKSFKDNRWRVTMPAGGLSRCWTAYGEPKAFAKCAAWAWHVHQLGGGEECPFDWIKSEDWRVGS